MCIRDRSVTSNHCSKGNTYASLPVFKRVVIGICAVLLSNCAGTNHVFVATEPANWDQLYLRGVFTWWEAEEQYRVQEVEKGLYRVSVELIADGQPYDFKFADQHWTPGLRCGYADKQQDQILRLGKVVKANCDTQVSNFKFTPDQSGKYHFYFDTRAEQQPSVYIVAAKQAVSE